MFTKEEPLTLENIGEGELVTQFNEVMTKMMRNIMDQSTTEDVREINIKIKMKPSPDNRGMVHTGFGIVPKFAPKKPVLSMAIISHEHGRFKINECEQAKQVPIPFREVIGEEEEAANDS